MGIYLGRDPRFGALVHGSAALERLAGGCRWAEGPVYLPAHRLVVWSDIPNDRLMRYDEVGGGVAVFQTPCGHQNGHALDREGRILACEHGGRAVTRLEHDGSRRVLAVSQAGRRLNSPNDVVVAADGAVWFTDPTYGIDSDYEGHAAPSEIGASLVYRLDPGGGLAPVVEDLVQPNGLAFSPDGRWLYVADTGRTHRPDRPALMRRYPVAADGRSVGAGEDFALCDVGLFDGLRVDLAGHVWTSAGDGVRVHAPDGTHLGTILTPEPVSNLCFGGPNRNRLYITATTSLYAVYVNARGAA